jgi:hypothetical protein
MSMAPQPFEDGAAADVRRALRAAALELEDLGRRRARLATAAALRWRGGRRAAFDDALARIDAETARVVATLRALHRLVGEPRAGDDAGDDAGPGTAGLRAAGARAGGS